MYEVGQRRVFVRPSPPGTRHWVAVSRLLAGVAVVPYWLAKGAAEQLAGRPWASQLPPTLLSPHLLGFGAAAATGVAWCLGLAWLVGRVRRRYGVARLGSEDALLDQPGGLTWRVRRVDITGWTTTPHGVLVQAARRVSVPDGRAMSGGGLRPYFSPLLIPTDHPAELAAALAWLAGRDPTWDGGGPAPADMPAADGAG